MVVNPVESFLENRLKYRTLRIQILATMVAGFAFAFDIGSIYLILEGQARIQYEGTAIILMIMYSLAPILFWFFITFAFYAIISLLGGRSEYTVLLRGTGWGMVPFTGAVAALAAGRYLGIRSKDPCNFPMIICKESAVVPLLDQVNALFAFATTAVAEPSFQIMFGLFTLLYLLSAYVWWETVKMSSNLTKLGVFTTVGVPVVLFYGLIFSLTF